MAAKRYSSLDVRVSSRNKGSASACFSSWLIHAKRMASTSCMRVPEDSSLSARNRFFVRSRACKPVAVSSIFQALWVNASNKPLAALRIAGSFSAWCSASTSSSKNNPASRAWRFSSTSASLASATASSALAFSRRRSMPVLLSLACRSLCSLRSRSSSSLFVVVSSSNCCSVCCSLSSASCTKSASFTSRSCLVDICSCAARSLVCKACQLGC